MYNELKIFEILSNLIKKKSIRIGLDMLSLREEPITYINTEFSIHFINLIQIKPLKIFCKLLQDSYHFKQS